MTDSATNSLHDLAPPGYKLLAWEGVGLFIPQRWDLGQRSGDYNQGFLRIDDEYRPVVQVRWWKTRGWISIDRVVQQYSRKMFTRKERQSGMQLKPLAGLSLPQGDTDRAQAFHLEATEDRPEREVLVIWQNRAANRAAVWRFAVEKDSPSLHHIQLMARGLCLQGHKDNKDFGLLDLAFRGPARYELQKHEIHAGVCYFRFSRSFGFDQLGLRRFSCANAVLGSLQPQVCDLVRWCRGIYAPEFYDMRYQIEETRDAKDRPQLVLRGRRRWLAPLEIGSLIPQHRRSPREIRILWDPPANKIYCLEILKLKPRSIQAADELFGSLRMTLDSRANGDLPDNSPPSRNQEKQWPKERRQRMRSLRAQVRRGKVEYFTNDAGRIVLKHIYERPTKLRLLRLLGSQPRGPSKAMRQVELDLIGSMIWEKIDSRTTFKSLTEEVLQQFHISLHEAELSVAHYIKTLGSRGLLAVKLPEID